jgi:hypothetical protein
MSLTETRPDKSPAIASKLRFQSISTSPRRSHGALNLLRVRIRQTEMAVALSCAMAFIDAAVIAVLFDAVPDAFAAEV